MIQTNHLKQFPPGHYIELDCAITGLRKLARVNESGFACYDRLELGVAAIPFPIYANLNPQDLGDISEWPSKVGANYLKDAIELWRRIGDQSVPFMTKVRAFWWSIENQVFNLEQAIKEGMSATARVQLAYDKMSEIARRAQMADTSI